MRNNLTVTNVKDSTCNILIKN